MDLTWLIRVYRDLPTAPDRVEVGTAYPIADRLVLVARHVVAEHLKVDSKTWLDIDPHKITLTWVNWLLGDGKPFAIKPPKQGEECQIVVKWDGRESGLDVALLECPLPAEVKIERSLLSDKDPPKGGEAWSSMGFAQAGLRDDIRQPQSLRGITEIYISGNTYHVGVDYAAKHQNDWRGLSGAPVFVNGKVQGLITDNVPPYGSARIEVVPTFLLLKIQAFRDALGTASLKPPTIDPAPFKTAIVQILQDAPSALHHLEEIVAARVEFRGKAISVSCDDPDRRPVHIVDRMFADLDSGGRLLRLALSEHMAPQDADAGDAFRRIACLFFPACFMREQSEAFLHEYKQSEKALIDPKATSVAWIEFRMAAIEGRSADFDPDQTRPDGPVGRMRIHNPPPFALEAMRKDEFREALARLLYEKVTSGVRRHIEKYNDFSDAINDLLEIGQNPEGVPYIVLGDLGDDKNAHLTDAEMVEIAKELRGVYSNLMVTCVSKDRELAKIEMKYLDWLWRKLKAK